MGATLIPSAGKSQLPQASTFEVSDIESAFEI
jgi:hypothetical protein